MDVIVDICDDSDTIANAITQSHELTEMIARREIQPTILAKSLKYSKDAATVQGR